MPVADLLVGAQVHVRVAVEGEEDGDQHGKDHHVAGESGEEKEANAPQQLARAAAPIVPVVVAPASAVAAAGGPLRNRRQAAKSRRSPLFLPRFVGKGDGHSQPL